MGRGARAGLGVRELRRPPPPPPPPAPFPLLLLLRAERAHRAGAGPAPCSPPPVPCRGDCGAGGGRGGNRERGGRCDLGGWVAGRGRKEGDSGASGTFHVQFEREVEVLEGRALALGLGGIETSRAVRVTAEPGGSPKVYTSIYWYIRFRSILYHSIVQVPLKSYIPVYPSIYLDIPYFGQVVGIRLRFAGGLSLRGHRPAAAAAPAGRIARLRGVLPPPGRRKAAAGREARADDRWLQT